MKRVSISISIDIVKVDLAFRRYNLQPRKATPRRYIGDRVAKMYTMHWSLCRPIAYLLVTLKSCREWGHNIKLSEDGSLHKKVYLNNHLTFLPALGVDVTRSNNCRLTLPLLLWNTLLASMLALFSNS
jgi:hypothetical protein